MQIWHEGAYRLWEWSFKLADKQTYQSHCYSASPDRPEQEPLGRLQLLACRGLLWPQLCCVWHLLIFLIVCHKQERKRLTPGGKHSKCVDRYLPCIQSPHNVSTGADGRSSVHRGRCHQDGHLSGSAGWGPAVLELLMPCTCVLAITKKKLTACLACSLSHLQGTAGSWPPLRLSPWMSGSFTASSHTARPSRTTTLGSSTFRFLPPPPTQARLSGAMLLGKGLDYRSCLAVLAVWRVGRRGDWWQVACQRRRADVCPFCWGQWILECTPGEGVRQVWFQKNPAMLNS